MTEDWRHILASLSPPFVPEENPSHSLKSIQIWFSNWFMFQFLISKWKSFPDPSWRTSSDQSWIQIEDNLEHSHWFQIWFQMSSCWNCRNFSEEKTPQTRLRETLLTSTRNCEVLRRFCWWFDPLISLRSPWFIKEIRNDLFVQLTLGMTFILKKKRCNKLQERTEVSLWWHTPDRGLDSSP